jgi:hypothetical protein
VQKSLITLGKEAVITHFLFLGEQKVVENSTGGLIFGSRPSLSPVGCFVVLLFVFMGFFDLFAPSMA